MFKAIVLSLVAVSLSACDTVSHAKFMDMVHGRGGSSDKSCYKDYGAGGNHRKVPSVRCPYDADFQGG